MVGPFVSPLEKSYWPVPTDGTLRIGDAVSSTTAFTPTGPLPDLGPQHGGAPFFTDDTPQLETGLQLREPRSDDKYFGFGSSRRSGGEIYAMHQEAAMEDVKETALWSRFEPFRFAVEFWGIDRLGEKERAYSTTQFHAGRSSSVFTFTFTFGPWLMTGRSHHRQLLQHLCPNGET
jgi:hypothetical protein